MVQIKSKDGTVNINAEGNLITLVADLETVFESIFIDGIISDDDEANELFKYLALKMLRLVFKKGGIR